MSETAEQKRMKNASRGFSRDMSPAAISSRFEKLAQINELCDWLGQGKRIGKDEPHKAGPR
ncbi:MAG: hypothetical protein ACKVHO_13425 [Verrucomicrobiia bacterium]|jgi:hypothetical protein